MAPQTGKILCVARNYAAHASELGNNVPDSPIFFIKPASALQPLDMPISRPRHGGSCHYEVELCLLMGPEKTISAVAIGLDLTLRDLQGELKSKGLPWAMAKGFKGSLPLGPWISPTEFTDLQDLQLELKINGKSCQKDSTALMIHSIETLIQAADQFFELEEGDILATGTPKGVGPLNGGDQLELILDQRFTYQTKVDP